MKTLLLPLTYEVFNKATYIFSLTVNFVDVTIPYVLECKKGRNVLF